MSLPKNNKLPEGTVTFLFTDIEGSTPLWEKIPGEMEQSVAQHHALLRQAIEANGGIVCQVIGDAFQAVFALADQGLTAAIAAQRRLQDAEWGATGPLKVRMGLHTGAAELDPLGNAPYAVSHTLNRSARIMSAGHGGQILLSQEGADLVRRSLPEGVSLKDLGEHHLKGMQLLEHLYQVCAPDLPQNFPSLSTSITCPHNLPNRLTSFIGRKQEVAEIIALLSQHRMVSLIGTGGTGKTRLSLQVARSVLMDFPDGAWLVELAPLADPALVPQTVASVLNLPERPGRSIDDTLVEFLHSKRLLIVLDNCEHLLEACFKLADRLLGACPELSMLASSRELLDVEGEVTYRVQPMALPDPHRLKTVQQLDEYDAVGLFVDRARMVSPGFKVTDDNAAAVIQVVNRLDGIPLAIELAAARLRSLSVAQIAQRLDDAFHLLTKGSRSSLPRHQTLSALIDWSYDLLSEQARILLRRLSIFAGGWSLEAAEQICASEEDDCQPLLMDDIIDLLSGLVDKSLVFTSSDSSGMNRFYMLETIRQYARGKFEEIDPVDLFAGNHMQYFLVYAEENARKLLGTDQVAALKRLEMESDNLRAAIAWSHSSPATAEESLRLVIALGNFWDVRGNLQEGRAWMSAVLAEQAVCAFPTKRAKALDLSANMAYRQSDYPAAKALWEESLQISRELGEAGQQDVVKALTGLGMVASEVGDYQTTHRLFAEGLEIARRSKDKPGEAELLRNLGWAAMRPGDFATARDHLESALVLFRKLNDEVRLASTLSGLGEVALRMGNYEPAKTLVEESLALRRKLGHKWGIGASLGTLGWACLAEGDYENAQRILNESLALRQELGDKGGIAWCLEKMALTAQGQGRFKQAARLYGAAASMRASIDSVIDPVDQPEYESQVEALKSYLNDEVFWLSWKEGERMQLDEAFIA